MKVLKLDRLLESPGHANLCMVRELYANQNHNHDHADVQEESVSLSRKDVTNYLGVNNHDPRILQKFIRSGTCTAIYHALCGMNSNAKWTRTKKGKYLETCSVDFDKTTKVWQNVVQARIMPAEKNFECTRARVCLIYFLIIEKPFNIGALILDEIACTRFGRM